MRRRTYRAHGRINGKKIRYFSLIYACIYLCISIFLTAYMSSPAHIEIVAEEKNEEVAKEEDNATAAVKFSRKQLARGRVPVGGDN